MFAVTLNTPHVPSFDFYIKIRTLTDKKSLAIYIIGMSASTLCQHDDATRQVYSVHPCSKYGDATTNIAIHEMRKKVVAKIVQSFVERYLSNVSNMSMPLIQDIDGFIVRKCSDGQWRKENNLLEYVRHIVDHLAISSCDTETEPPLDETGRVMCMQEIVWKISRAPSDVDQILRCIYS